jgi:hypothetical protein
MSNCSSTSADPQAERDDGGHRLGPSPHLGRVAKGAGEPVTVAVRQRPAWLLRAVLSERIAIPRHCLSLLKHRSTTLRPR